MLRARWEQDAVALAPTVVSIMVGINDTWRRYDSGTPTSTDEYEENLRAIVAGVDRLVLIEPFVVPVTADQHAWREDLDPRIAVVRRIANEHSVADEHRIANEHRIADEHGVATERRAVLVPADGLFAAAAARTGPATWADDGVHPTAAGHGLLAEAWLDAVGLG